MTDHDALLRAIVLHPAEDTPRLMYADEIEGSDPARAEFLRLQIAFDRSGVAGVIPRGIVRLYANPRGGAQWFGPDIYPALGRRLHETGPGAKPSGLVRRGFVSELRAEASQLTALGAALFAANPIEAVVVPGTVPPMQLTHGPDAGRWFWPLRDLPAPLRAALQHCGPFTAHHPTQADALAALSDAWVNYGRELAGLPPLAAG